MPVYIYDVFLVIQLTCQRYWSNDQHHYLVPSQAGHEGQSGPLQAIASIDQHSQMAAHQAGPRLSPGMDHSSWKACVLRDIAGRIAFTHTYVHYTSGSAAAYDS